MKLVLAAALAVFAAGCSSTSEHKPIATQVVTFPDGALVEFDGKPMGRAPAKIILPQDEFGRLTGQAVVRAVPNSEQHTLYAQQRVFEPGERQDRVPNQIMIDLTLRGTNEPTREVAAEALSSTEAPQRPTRQRPKYIDRGKPTQAVGLDRWNPGKY